ncbi:MAG: lysophospholipid acyltransferase family protein [Acidobacteriota bacterium]
MLAFFNFFAWWVLRTLFAVEYHGVENVPLEGAVIIAGNHPSYLDPVLVMLPVKRTIKFMAWDALFRVPVLGRAIRALGAFPVDLRKGKGEAAFLEARRILTEGNALGIFPEGQRSERGPMGDLKTGTARLAIETGAPIIPVTIGGAFRAWPKWKLLPKPAKIIVRFHPPIRLDPAECAERREDREFSREVMQDVATRINRSLAPALRGSDAWERRYRQPPSHIRSYEWAPTLAALIATVICLRRGHVPWLGIWLPVAAYGLYLLADLLWIKPSRFAKWLRNSMPIWMILAWHYPLTEALEVPAGAMLGWLLLILLAVFFVFFYEDYFNLQKFVRGIVTVYYFSLVLQLKWPSELGLFVVAITFMIVFSQWFGVAFRWVMTVTLTMVLAIVLYGTTSLSTLIPYAGLAVLAIAYLQTFASFAYDIRRQLVTSN